MCVLSVPVSPRRTCIMRDLAVELHLSAQHAASRRSEVHGAVSNAEALPVHVNHSVEAATTSLCETVWLLWDPNLSEDARRCLQPDGAHAWRMLLQIVTHGLLALQETPGAHMLCVPPKNLPTFTVTEGHVLSCPRVYPSLYLCECVSLFRFLFLFLPLPCLGLDGWSDERGGSGGGESEGEGEVWGGGKSG